MPSLQAGAFYMDEQMSAFTAINGYSTDGSIRTVSPRDIFRDLSSSSNSNSAPPSSTFTNITTPGASPFAHDFNYSSECSPMFQTDPNMSCDEWPSLFDDSSSHPVNSTSSTDAISMPMDRTVSSQSMERSGSSNTGSPIILDASFRRKSSATNSPATNGVSKSRRRKGPLPVITVDPNDKVALKRARNTLAARESRQRKFDHVHELETRTAELEAEVEKWKNIAIAHGYNGS